MKSEQVNKSFLLKESLRLRNQKVAQKCLNDYFTFFYIFWDVINSDKLKVNWHIPFIADELQAIGESVINREPKPYDLIINVPPGSTKSNLASIFFLLWLWLNDPSIVVIVSSYSGDLSVNYSIKAKRIFESDLFQEIFQPYFISKFGGEISLIKDNEKVWINNFNGSFIFTSTGGTITGKHAHLIIRDDPMSPEIAVSDAMRLRANRYNDQTLSSRKVDKENTPTITIMQRLHEDDTTGHDLAKENKKIRHICLPAEEADNINPPELREKYKDGLLDPVRLNRNILRDQKDDLGNYGYSGQYGQDPVIDELAILKRHYWKFVSDKQVNPFVQWHMFIDGAFTEKTENDPTGFLIAGIWEHFMYVKFAESVRLETPELIPRIIQLSTIHGLNAASLIYIEPKASGQSIRPLINSGSNFNAVDIQSVMVNMSKVERANRIAPRLQAGKVNLVEGYWNDEFVTQCAKFPKAKHDEYVDLICYAVDILMPLQFKNQTGKKVKSKASIGLV